MAVRYEITDMVFRNVGGTMLAHPSATCTVKDLQGNNLTIYQAETGASTFSNPLTSDANGQIEGWVEAPDFDIAVTGSGITSYTQKIRQSSPDTRASKSWGAVANGATNDYAALAAMFTNAASGGVIELASGTHMVGTMLDSSASNVKVKGAGRGLTVLKLANGVNNHLLNITGNGWVVEDLTLDGNRANQTAGHTLRASGEDHSFTRLVIKEAWGYGIGMSQSAGTSVKRVTIDDVYLLNTGNDAIESKDIDAANEGNQISNVVIRGHGLNGTTQAGIDCRGPWQLTNIFVYDLTGDDVGVRFRASDSGVTGWGCDGSSLTGFSVKAASAAATGTGVSVASANVQVSNGYTHGVTGASGALVGVDVGGQNSKVSNVHATSGGIGFIATANWVEFDNCHAISNNDGFRVDSNDVLILGGAARANLRYGLNVNAGVRLRIPELRFSANTTAAINPANTIASAGAIDVPMYRDVWHVTGTTTITSIGAANSGYEGRIITLIFDGILTFTDGSNLKLAGNFVTTADDAITLRYDGTNFYELSRAVN